MILNSEISKLDLFYDDKYITQFNLNKINNEECGCLIIESKNKINPSDYTEYFFDNLVSDYKTYNKCLFLDLSDIYGIDGDSWLYKWELIIDNNEFLYQDLIPITEMNLNKCYDFIIKKYIYNKFRSDSKF